MQGVAAAGPSCVTCGPPAGLLCLLRATWHDGSALQDCWADERCLACSVHGVCALFSSGVRPSPFSSASARFCRRPQTKALFSRKFSVYWSFYFPPVLSWEEMRCSLRSAQGSGNLSRGRS